MPFDERKIIVWRKRYLRLANKLCTFKLARFVSQKRNLFNYLLYVGEQRLGDVDPAAADARGLRATLCRKPPRGVRVHEVDLYMFFYPKLREIESCLIF